jgi:hypothetical protein
MHAIPDKSSPDITKDEFVRPHHVERSTIGKPQGNGIGFISYNCKNDVAGS